MPDFEILKTYLCASTYTWVHCTNTYYVCIAAKRLASQGIMQHIIQRRTQHKSFMRVNGTLSKKFVNKSNFEQIMDDDQDILNRYKGVWIALGIVGLLLLIFGLLKWRSMKKKAQLRKMWADVGKDVVVLHQPPRARFCPSGSPYPIKLETFLR